MLFRTPTSPLLFCSHFYLQVQRGKSRRKKTQNKQLKTRKQGDKLPLLFQCCEQRRQQETFCSPILKSCAQNEPTILHTAKGEVPFKMQTDRAVFQAHHPHVYHKNNTWNKSSAPDAGTSTAAWEIICLSHPQPKLLLWLFCWRHWESWVQLHPLMKRIFNVSHGHRFACNILSSIQPATAFSHNISLVPHGP